MNVRGGLMIHGLRHGPVRDTCGWYIWAAELSADDDFFKPLQWHTSATGVPP